MKKISSIRYCNKKDEWVTANQSDKNNESLTYGEYLYDEMPWYYYAISLIEKKCNDIKESFCIRLYKNEIPLNERMTFSKKHMLLL